MRVQTSSQSAPFAAYSPPVICALVMVFVSTRLKSVSVVGSYSASYLSWNPRTSDSSDGQGGVEHDGLKMFPIWSIVLTILVFAGWLYISYYAQPHHHGPQPFRLL